MTIPAKKFREAVRGLEETRPGPGLRKTFAYSLLVLPCFFFALTSEATGAALAWALIGACLHASWMITTHDALHRTLTGWGWFDEILPRIISYPILWNHGVYAQLHKMHHRMNGDNLNDPERVQSTVAEYQAAGAFGRWMIRHQWFLQIFVFAGAGLVFKNWYHAFKHAGRSKALRREISIDFFGAVVCATALGLLFGERYAMVWFCVERVTGGVLALRAHVEHYGLWGKREHYFATQFYNCRNTTTNRFMKWYINGLNFHSVHHVFPKVPFYNLEKVDAAFRLLSAEADEPMVEGRGYLAEALFLAKHPQLIDDQNWVSLPVKDVA